MKGIKAKRLAAAGFLFLFILISTGGLAHAYSAILAFGDSLSDNGTTALNGIAGDTYGFKRYSNGPVWVEYLAGTSHFNAPLMDLAYGGATSGWDNPAASKTSGVSYYDTNTGLQWQVATYTAKYTTIASTALVTVWAGGNDMFNYAAAVPYTAVSAANKAAGLYNPAAAAANIGQAVQNLINIGGLEFLVPNLSYNSTDPYKGWKEPFDVSLALVLAGLKAANPGVHIYGVDMNGFVIPSEWIPALQGTFLNPNGLTGTFASYDGVHPTTEAHALIANYTASAVPIPASLILMLSGIAALIGLKKKMKI